MSAVRPISNQRVELFVSTTWFGKGQTDVGEVLDAMEGLDIDGIELGSTHAWRDDLEAVVESKCDHDIFSHNYFPPARDDIVLNIASLDGDMRDASVRHAREAIAFAARVGARLYTIHPGFLADALPPSQAPRTDGTFDMVFGENVRGGLDEALANLRRSLEVLMEDAARFGVPLAVETQGSFVDTGISLLERPGDYVTLHDLFDQGLAINFNLAHSGFAAGVYDFDLEDFVADHQKYFAAVELSDNDGRNDLHRPLSRESFVLPWISRLKTSPLILEFRDAAPADLTRSIELVRQAAQT